MNASRRSCKACGYYGSVPCEYCAAAKANPPPERDDLLEACVVRIQAPGDEEDLYADALQDAKEELERAAKNFPAFNSAHEGWGVLAEEVDELWDQVKVNQKKRDLGAMRKEAIQVAAMALRFAAEVCSEERGRK